MKSTGVSARYRHWLSSNTRSLLGRPARPGRQSDAYGPALRIAVSRFLSGEGRDHVVGVGFLSESGLQPLEAGLVESGGTAYYFPKRESPKWSDDFSGLFTWNRPNAKLGGDGLGSSP